MKNSPMQQLEKIDPKNLEPLTEPQARNLVEFIRSYPEKLGKEAKNAEKIIKMIEEKKVKLLKLPVKKPPLNLAGISGGTGPAVSANQTKIGEEFISYAQDGRAIVCIQMMDVNENCDYFII